MRSLPVGLLRTRKIRTTANRTAAMPPATPNRAVLGSIYLPRFAERKPRRSRLKELAESPREVEGLERPCRLRPVGVDAAHARHPGPPADGALELGQRLRRALGDQLHRAVAVVADPAGQAEVSGLALDEVPKADALHVAVDDRVKPLLFMLVRCHFPALSRSATSWSAASLWTPTRTG